MKVAPWSGNRILLTFNFTWCWSNLSSKAMSLRSWSILASVSEAPQPGIKMSSAILMTCRSSRTMWILRCHSSEAEDMPNGSWSTCSDHTAWTWWSLGMISLLEGCSGKLLWQLSLSCYSSHVGCGYSLPKSVWCTKDDEWSCWGSGKV